MARTLIVDENLDNRLALQLKGRGRAALALKDAGLLGMGDKELLEWIAENQPDGVLVTLDDDLPADHRSTLQRTRVAVAVVDPRKPLELTHKQWQCEAVHRWAHQIAGQKKGTVRRYGQRSSVWKDRRGRGRILVGVPKPTDGGPTLL